VDNVIDFNKARRLNFEHYNISDYTQGALERYVLDRLPPGGFLTSVLANDLFMAVNRADQWNSQTLKDICNWIHDRAPPDCWGSYEIVQKYLSTPRIK
jgi:hypothetical protein